MKSTNSILLEARQLSRNYGAFHAMYETDFALTSGKIVVLTGVNGAGKTTLLRTLSGLLRPSSGTVIVEGFNLYREERQAKQRLAFVPDVPRFYTELTAWEHLQFFARAFNSPDNFEVKEMSSRMNWSTKRMDDTVLVLDFGGTKLAAAVVDLGKEKIVSPVIRQQTPVSLGASGTLKTMIECGTKALATFDQSQHVKAVGISFGGPVSDDRQSVLLSNHVVNWNGAPLVDEISQAFQLPAVMDNDGNVAALGEWWFGGYRHLDNMAYIQISTGVGGGLIIGRKLYRGSGLAGELGHYIVELNGPQCSCGRKGCLESVCSGWAIAREGWDALSKRSDSCPSLVQLSQNKPEAVTASMVFEACRAFDPVCVAIIHRALNNLAIMIVNLITCIDPQVVVIGGGLTRSRDIFEEYLIPVVQEQIHPFFKGRCQIKISALDGKEILLGAALLTQEKTQGKSRGIL